MEDVTALAKQVARLLRKSGLETYDQTKHVFREVRKQLDLSPPKRRGRNTVKRLSVEHLRSFLKAAGREEPKVSLMMQTLYESAVRVSEFTSLEARDFTYDQRRLVVRAGKGGQAPRGNYQRGTGRNVAAAPGRPEVRGAVPQPAGESLLGSAYPAAGRPGGHRRGDRKTGDAPHAPPHPGDAADGGGNDAGRNWGRCSATSSRTRRTSTCAPRRC